MPLKRANFPAISPVIHQSVRCKSKKKKQQISSESETDKDDSDIMENISDKHTKTLKINVHSLRLDAILKSSLGIARNKIEQIFYESKIRVNGEKVLKKSVSLREGDEVDVIKGEHTQNPGFLVVARVEILSMTPNEEDITLKIRRSKSLLVENYKDKWTP